MKIVDGLPYLDEVKVMIKDYVQWLNRDLSFQNLEEELADVAARYCEPNGHLLVALADSGEVKGMVAYKKLSECTCEMKRLYVKESFRGSGAGDALIKEIITIARNEGLDEMVLDTIEPLKAAIALYERNGFVQCAPYYHNPMPDVRYYSRAL